MVSIETVVCRSRFRRNLALMVAGIALVVIVWGLIDDIANWPMIAPALLAALVAYALFWNPAVVVTPAAVEVRNILRTIELPWPAIRSVDTRFALTLETAYGQYAAWAAPAPGRSSAIMAQRGADRAARRGGTPATETIAVGDLATSPSGAAAGLIRERLDELRAAGMLDNPQLERDRPRVTWHWPIIAGVLALTAATVAAALMR